VRTGGPAWLALLILTGYHGVLPAQEPRGSEIGLGAILVARDPAWVGGGLYGALRPGGKARLAVLTALGVVSGRAAGRGEVLAHFMLTPNRRSGAGLYGSGGVAGQVGGGRDQGYLVLGLGLESAPGGASGWVLEAGVGGGFRASLGWRWRQLRRPGTQLP
jgi:hypothetical protein